MLLFLASLVLADEIARNSCCAAVGASGTCANELSIYGEGSSAAAGSAGLLVTGAWRMSCGQPARFDANYRTTVEREPRKGGRAQRAESPERTLFRTGLRDAGGHLSPRQPGR